MFKKFTDCFLALNDSGKLLKSPFKWLYVLSGVLCFLPFIAFLVALHEFWDDIISVLGDGFWTNFVTLFVIILFGFSLIVIGLIGFHFWNDRKNRLDKVIPHRSKAVAIPLIADRVQCRGQIWALLLFSYVVCGCVLAYIACMLTNGFGFYSDFGFIWMLLGAVVIAFVAALLGYFNILISQFVAERIRLIAQIGNDVQAISENNGHTSTQEKDNPMNFKSPMLDGKEKKIACAAVICAAIIAFAGATIIGLGDSLAMKKSIYTELDGSRVGSISQNKSNFYEFYYNVRSGCNESADDEAYSSFKSISYSRLWKFYNDFYTNTELKEKVQQSANKKYDKDVLPSVSEDFGKIIQTWKNFTKENDPSLYLTINTATSNYRETGGYWSYDRPQFYFTYETPKGEVVDATIEFYPVNEYGSNYFSSSSTISFKELVEEYSEGHNRHYTGIDNARFWEDHSMKVNVKSVTLADGRIISSSSLDQIPSSVREYLADESEENMVKVIREEIDVEFMNRDEYINSAWNQTLSKADNLCFTFVSEYM